MTVEELRRQSTLCDECGETVAPGDECPECADESDCLVHDRCCEYQDFSGPRPPS